MNQTSAPPTMRIDLHCHTLASPDCKTPLAAVLEACARNHLDVLAVTDHNQIWAAQELAAMQPQHVKIIVGEEVYTSHGEIIGLFLQQRIEPRQSPERTIAEIKDQGGLVLLPHGFDRLKPSALDAAARDRNKAAFDIIEGFNGHVALKNSNELAQRWAAQYGLPVSGGSDAHRAADIGSVYVETLRRSIAAPQELLEALRAGRLVGTHRNPVISFFRERLGF